MSNGLAMSDEQKSNSGWLIAPGSVLIAHCLEREGDAAANRACRIYQVNSLTILA